MNKTIGVIRGDHCGKEIIASALEVLDASARKHNHEFEKVEIALGGDAIDKYGHPIPDHELEKAKACDAVLLGAVGGPEWDHLPGDIRPEKGLLGIRKGMNLYTNLRPAKIWPQLSDASPLKKEIVDQGIDFLIVRELTGGVYFGEHKTVEENGLKKAVDIMAYDENEIRRLARVAFETAMKRNKKLHLVDKANVLDTSRLWRAVFNEEAKNYPEVDFNIMLVDNCAMQICKNPAQFDVIATENMFGDILSDEASEITGSIGMIPSASLGDTKAGLYEPIHGSAPDISGQNKVNPIATILSAAMMLRYSFDMDQEADEIEEAVSRVLDKGYRTADMMSEGMIPVSTTEMTKAVIDELNRI